MALHNMEPYTRHLIFGGQSHGLSSACTARRIKKMSNSKGKQPKLSAFFVKKDPSTSGTGVVQGDHAGEPSAVHSEQQDDKLKIHYPDIGLLQKTSAKLISPDVICDLLNQCDPEASDIREYGFPAI